MLETRYKHHDMWFLSSGIKSPELLCTACEHTQSSASILVSASSRLEMICVIASGSLVLGVVSLESITNVVVTRRIPGRLSTSSRKGRRATRSGAYFTNKIVCRIDSARCEERHKDMGELSVVQIYFFSAQVLKLLRVDMLLRDRGFHLLQCGNLAQL